ncbi:hypothetical protein LZZ85_05620 [Terrimonas sp. NA20]|uniref:Uncharacterized protein n=1 Tax=Terrimonas ginsenosidimutans TaxID=2908004 RepID=A0ABS9KN43_9BACT|nr:hypothetical protein [Terrimonas ginsenosidimutans]MCG2613746.1 hypothetical protein [Terrimonas ginsenosidimutans]
MLRQIFMLFAILFLQNISQAQYTYKIKADSVKITNDSCTAELILENSTKAVKGILYNYGNGRTEFRKAMLKLNDSLYLFGNDTLNIAAAIRLNGGGSSAIPISSLLAATKVNTIDNGSYQQDWQWNTLAGGTGLRLRANTSAATSSTQKLLSVELNGTNSNADQITYAGYFANEHAASTGAYTSNIGIYSKATGDVFHTNAGRFDVYSTHTSSYSYAIYGYAVNASADKTNNHAGVFTNNGGNNVIRLEQEGATEIAGIGFAGINGTWGFGKRNTSGALEFNNSRFFSGHRVLQLFPQNRVRIGGYDDDHIHTFQVYGTTWMGDNAGILQSPAVAYLNIGKGNDTVAPLKLAAGVSLTIPQNGAVEYDGTNYYVTSGNTRYTLSKTLAATATLDFASTGAQSYTDLTVTVSGAADGDAVSLGIPGSSVTGNGSYMAWISAANTVTVRFNNFGAAAVNPASGSFKIVVTKN